MPHYLLSAHSVEGETRPAMTEEQMRAFQERIDALDDEMRAAGAWMFAGRLHDVDTATVVRSTDGKVVTTDGPFAESKEHLAGFYVIEAQDLDAAIGWAAKASECVGISVEVRPFQDLETD